MEEEKNTNTNTNDNTNTSKAVDNNQSNTSSDLSLKDAVSNIAGAVNDSSDGTKYKSKKNNFTNTDDTKANANANNSAINRDRTNAGLRGRFTNTAKNMLANKATSLIPGLGALNTANNIRKGIMNGIGGVRGSSNNSNSTNNREVSDKSNANDGITNEVTGDDNSKTDVDTSSDGGKKGLGSLGSLKGLINGKFSFFGKISLPVKIGMALGPIGILFFMIIIVVMPIALFSSFFGMDEVDATDSVATVGNIDYGDYELSSDGDTILHESLSSFLSSQGSSLTEFNNLISTNINNAGYGTNAGVVAAAVTLIAELGNNYDVKIPYYWGGGHGSMFEGADGSWGSSSCHTTANGKSYNYCGLDCSGFVAWAIYNGGFNITATTAGNFQNLSGAERVSLNSTSAVLEPGDLLESNSHVVLVVGVDEENNGYICAEASGSSTGVLFTRRSFSQGGYWGVKMSGFYANNVRS